MLIMDSIAKEKTNNPTRYWQQDYSDEKANEAKKKHNQMTRSRRRNGQMPQQRKGPQGIDPFPGPAPIDEGKKKKYGHNNLTEKPTEIATSFHIKKYNQIKTKHDESEKLLARAELLATEEPGFLETGEDEKVTQDDIKKAVDIGSATKNFDLMLQHGPYSIDYTTNGRFLGIGGREGHLAAFDWLTKQLLFEVNVDDAVRAIQFLHQESMMAVAQSNYTYIYDSQGVEIHCIKALHDVCSLQFLPFHFLLVAGSNQGYLSYLDVTMGEPVASYPTRQGRLNVLTQNRSNALIVTGHSDGNVCMWTPCENQPVVKMYTHNNGIRSLAVDNTGRYLITAATDRKMKVWDLRKTYENLSEIRLPDGPSKMVLSQRNILATSINNTVQMYNTPFSGEPITRPYLVHRFRAPVSGLQFCPYEDVLGCGLGSGFASLLCPGAGEANFDALEDNPMQSKKHRQEKEVKRLLDKIPYTAITLDANIGMIHRDSIEEEWKKKERMLLGKPEKPVVNVSKNKAKGRSKDSKVQKRKDGLVYTRKMFSAAALMEASKKRLNDKKKPAPYVKKSTNSILDVLGAKQF